MSNDFNKHPEAILSEDEIAEALAGAAKMAESPTENERTDSPTKWLTEDEFVELHGEMLKELHGLSEEEIRMDFRAAKEWNEELQRMREKGNDD